MGTREGKEEENGSYFRAETWTALKAYFFLTSEATHIL